MSGWTIEAFHNLGGDVAGNAEQPLSQAEVDTGPFDATGAVTAVTTSTKITSGFAFSANVDGDFAVGDSLQFTTGSAAGQIAAITAVSGGQYTVSGLTVAPADGDMFHRISGIVGSGPTTTTTFPATPTPSGYLGVGDWVQFSGNQTGTIANDQAEITAISGNQYTLSSPLSAAPSGASGVVASGTSATSFTATVTGSLAVGDWLQFASNTATAALQNQRVQIMAISGDAYTLSTSLPATPAVGDTFVSGDVLARIQIAVTAADGAYSIPLDTGPANAADASGTPANYALVEKLQTGWNEVVPNATTARAFSAFAAGANNAGIYGPYGYAVPIAVGTGVVTDQGFQNSKSSTPIANLAVTKVGLPTSVTAGNDLTYTITVTNNGPADALQMAMTDPVPTDTTFVSVVLPTGWTRTDAVPVGGTGTLDFSDGTLPDGKSVTFTLVVQVDSNTPSGTIVTNVATATSPTDPNPATGTATNTVVTLADLAVTKVGLPNPVTAGNDLTYTITVTNDGPSDAQQMAMTDPVPIDTTFVSAVPPTGWTRTDAVPVGGTGTLDFSDGTLPAGKSVVFTLVVEVDSGTPSGTIITNVATATSPTDPNPATGTATNTVSSSDSLSGYVYDDAYENGIYERGNANPQDNDIGLPNVTVSVSSVSNGVVTPVQVTTTGPDGLYDFEGLAPGTYQITETQPVDFQITKLTLGVILPLNATPPATPIPPGQIGPGTNEFSGIALSAGEEGVDYNFGEMPTVVTKRMFLAASSSQDEIYAELGVTAVTINAPTPSDTISAAISNNLVTVTTVTSAGTSTSQNIPTSTANVVLIDASTTSQPVTITDNRTGVLASSAPTDVAIRRADEPVTQDSGVEVINARQVTLNGVKGNNDLAAMYDSPGNDTLTAGNGTTAGESTAKLTTPATPAGTPAAGQRPNTLTTTAGFDTVQAFSINGGVDTANKQLPIDYLLELYGNWST